MRGIGDSLILLQKSINVKSNQIVWEGLIIANKLLWIVSLATKDHYAQCAHFLVMKNIWDKEHLGVQNVQNKCLILFGL